MEDKRRDIQLVELFLRGLNEDERESYEICARPEQLEHTRPAVEAIAKNRLGALLAIEHTLVQAFENQKEDDVRFNRVFGELMSDQSAAVPGRRVLLFVPASSIPKGVDWSLGGQRVCEWFKAVRLALPDGDSEHTIPGLGFVLRVTVHTMDITKWVHRGYGVVHVARTLPDKRFPERVVRKALCDKLPKLADAKFEGNAVERRILLAEWQTSSWSYPQIAEAVDSVAPEFPQLDRIEAIWLVDTAGWPAGRSLLYETIWPGKARRCFQVCS
jgi:hypothetical protein